MEIRSRTRAKSYCGSFYVYRVKPCRIGGRALCDGALHPQHFSDRTNEHVRDAPAFNVPRGVFWALAAIILIHVIRLLLPDDADIWLVFALAFIPGRYVETALVFPGGALSSVFSLVSYMFVHGDAMHLIVNSLWLLAFGSAVAKRVGDLRFALFAAFCGIAGALTHLVVNWGDMTPVVGASAAISGLMAASVRFLFSGTLSQTMADFRHNPAGAPLVPIVDALRDPRILVFLGVWIGLNLLFGLGAVDLGDGTAIAWEAHFGGFFAGLFGFSLFDRPATDNYF